MTMPAPAPRRSRTVAVGVVIAVIGMVAAVTSVVAGMIAASAATADLPTVSAPGEVTVELVAGRHSLWVPDDRNLTFYDITISGPAEVEYRPYGFFGSTDAIVRDGQSYRSDGFFEVPVAGRYTVTATDDGQELAEPTTIIVGPGDGYGVVIFAWSALGVLLGAFVALVGMIVAVIGTVRRNRSRSSP